MTLNGLGCPPIWLGLLPATEAGAETGALLEAMWLIRLALASGITVVNQVLCAVVTVLTRKVAEGGVTRMHCGVGRMCSVTNDVAGTMRINDVVTMRGDVGVGAGAGAWGATWLVIGGLGTEDKGVCGAIWLVIGGLGAEDDGAAKDGCVIGGVGAGCEREGAASDEGIEEEGMGDMGDAMVGGREGLTEGRCEEGDTIEGGEIEDG